MRRSLILLPLVFVVASPHSARTDDKNVPEGFTPLFNGKDLTGWRVNEGGNLEVWGAENGVLFVKGGGGGWLMTDKEYSDFELRLDFKMPEKGNSGVAIRCALKGNPHLEAGMEIQLLDDEYHRRTLPDLKVSQLTGSVYDIQGPAVDALKPIGQWNSMRIVAKGRQLSVELNSVKTVDINLDKYQNKVKTHKGMLNEKGHLGLQSHDGRVEFRNLYVKELK
jgi:hypothetical protein